MMEKNGDGQEEKEWGWLGRKNGDGQGEKGSGWLGRERIGYQLGMGIVIEREGVEKYKRMRKGEGIKRKKGIVVWERREI